MPIDQTGDTRTLHEFASAIPDCTGNIVTGIDGFYSTFVGQPDKTGWCAMVTVKGAVYTGRGLSRQEAEDALEKRLRTKFADVALKPRKE